MAATACLPVEAWWQCCSQCNSATCSIVGPMHTPLQGAVSDPDLQGVVPRAISHLGSGIADASAQQEALFKVSLSVVVGGAHRCVVHRRGTPSGSVLLRGSQAGLQQGQGSWPLRRHSWFPFPCTCTSQEIYCERVRCLLDPAGGAGKDNLQVMYAQLAGMLRPAG
jgi:hypothetical protein